MDEQDLFRQIKDYADALGRAADRHLHRDPTPQEVSSLISTRTTPNRARRSVLVSVVLATVLVAGGLAAIVVNRSSTPRRTTPSSNSAPPTRGSTTTTGVTSSPPAACTATDIAARGNVPLPTPGVVTHRIYDASSLSSVDPPSSTQPAITAARAWQMAGKFWTRSPLGTYEILLGNFSSTTVSSRLAWLIIGHHVPSAPAGGPAPAPGVTTPPRPPCYFTDLLQPIDATTGQSLFVETGGLHLP